MPEIYSNMHLPETFIERTKALFGADTWEQYVRALEAKRPISIRLNPYKTKKYPEQTKDNLFESIPFATSVPWASDAWYLSERPSFISDPLFHMGCYYVQEAASMFLEQFIKTHIHAPVTCLDLCAAPGGKSTHLSSILPEGSLLIANEVIRSRAHILAENLIKWGNPATVITNNDPEHIGHLTHFFDVIVADVPCSGEGMFRKDPDAVSEWSPANVKLCSERQRRIISSIWNSLKPGGILIYSTCTFNTEENEENIQWIKDTYGATSLDIPLQNDWNIQGISPYYRFIPGKTKGEGFFISAIKKPDDETLSSLRIRFSEKKMPQKHNPFLAHIQHWLTGTDYDFDMENQTLYAIPSLHRDARKILKEKLKIIQAGITIGSVKGKDIIPEHSLAMSHRFVRKVFPEIEVDTSAALLYLRKQAIQLTENAPKGYNVLTYKNLPLGFVKNIGNRANNLYPNEWRIRNVIV